MMQNNKLKKTLKKHFEVEPIKIKIVKLERMFIDKVFAAEFYYIRKEYTDVSKHIYDLCVLINNDKIKELFYNEQEFINYVNQKGLARNVDVKNASSAANAELQMNVDLINQLPKLEIEE